MSRAARAIGAALCVLALAGCAPLAAAVGVDGGGPALRLAQVEHGRFATVPSEVRVERVSSSPESSNAWTVGVVDPASARIRISWVDGPSLECGQVDRLQVQETAKAVVIGLAATQRDPDRMCIAVGVLRSKAVALHAPLGRRALLEGVPGANDGLPTVQDPGSLPSPACTGDDVTDAPVGMVDVGTRMAPADATTAFICRTWWPDGRARSESRSLTDRDAVAALVASLNRGVTDLRPADVAPVPCPSRLHGSQYDVYLRGPALQVEVKVDEIDCRTITNGALSGTLTPALARTLDAQFG